MIGCLFLSLMFVPLISYKLSKGNPKGDVSFDNKFGHLY